MSGSDKITCMTTERSILVRRAVAGDAAQLIALNKKFNDSNDVNTDVFAVGQMIAAAAPEIVLVAESGGLLIGFACVQIQRSFCLLRPTLEITEMFVERRARRSKTATLLIREVFALAAREKASEVYLRVSKNNDPAVKLYRSAGLTEAAHLVFRKRFS